MNKFWLVTLFHWQPSPEIWQEVESIALDKYESLGIEEFSIDEAEVDHILGERSYSGGDLPLDVIDEVEANILGRPQNYRFFFESKARAEEFLTEIQSRALCEIQIDEKDQEDWNAEWKKHYSPIKVNKELEIIPSWLESFKSSSKKQIYIYPGMGFGTGSHETTFLCLKLFTDYISGTNSQVETVLDFGSGSGILGLASLLFYPDAKVDFYDIDPEANKNCYENARINNLVDSKFRLLLPEVRTHLNKSYDVVFANILENILLEEVDFLVNSTSPKGYLILSGLLNHQVQGIINVFSRGNLVLEDSVSKNDWGALIFRKV